MSKVLKKNIDKNVNNLVFYVGEVHKDILTAIYPIFKRRNDDGRKRKPN
jgi:hypothetical protein